MEDDFLANYLIVYIEKKIVERFTIDMIIDEINFIALTQIGVTPNLFTLYKSHYMVVISYLNKTKSYRFFFYNSCIIN
jgi:hypothetical protein